MFDVTATAIDDSIRAGRTAFRTYGVSGQTKHSYPEGSAQKIGFLTGFSEEQFRASERALADAVAYHNLVVKDAAKDQAWANRLAAARNI
ncbi:hypothetical protein [Burkholderia ubonensis]|uniref:hypothetical protein n=1 Tax=Burkholderia ubonensis TaxID=101571 RepID=UPI00075E5EB3|nr:hypothetical protein [Burkholderia ubonensis]KVP17011.1 hypothetical protein WJ84_01685 [Burkholderia ubonensis]KVP39863.1 hypothetical protein WJ87_06680 [Burkholderia ubonensis]